MEIMYHGAFKKLEPSLFGRRGEKKNKQKVVDSETFLNRGICGIGILGIGMIILLLICFATEETVKKDLE